jgi:serine/threonine protein kinase
MNASVSIAVSQSELALDAFTQSYLDMPVPMGRGVWRWLDNSHQWHCIKARSDDSGHYLIANEWDKLSRIQSQHVPKVLAHRVLDQASLLVTDYSPGTTVSHLIKHRGAGFSDYEIIVTQLINALMDCHRHSVVHGDIKPNNLVFDGETLQLIDFGHAGLIGELLQEKKYRGFSPSFSLPSLKEGQGKVSTDADWYSFFIVVYVLKFGRLPVFDFATDKPISNIWGDLIQEMNISALYRKFLVNRITELDQNLC